MPDFFSKLEKPVDLLQRGTFESNQKNQLTAEQTHQLEDAAGWKHIILVGLLVIMLGIAFILSFIAIFFGGIWSNRLWPLLCMSGFFLLILRYMAPAVWKQLGKAIRIKRDMNGPAICQGAGKILEIETGWAFEMSGIWLHLPAHQPNGLLPGVTYQVYYLPESSFVLSALAIEEQTF